MQIKIAIQDEDVKAALLRLQDKVGNLKPAMEEIGQLYERSVLENFSKESAPDGTPWRPCAHSRAGMNQLSAPQFLKCQRQSATILNQRAHICHKQHPAIAGYHGSANSSQM